MGRRQRLTVKLAVGGQWQRRQTHHVRGHHVRRQTAAQVRIQRLAQRAFIGQRVARHHITDQLAADRAFTVHHKGFAYALVFQQAGFDFPQFNAETADLHLLVNTPQVLDHAIFAQSRQVAAAIQACTGHERVRYKALGGQLRTLMIAASNALAAQVQLTRHTYRQRLQMTVEHIRTALPHRAADRQERRIKLRARIRAPDQRRDDGFGRAITVDDAWRLQHPLHFIERVLGHALTAHGVGTNRQPAPCFADVIGHLQQVAGGETGDGYAVALDLFAGALSAPDFIVTRHQRRAEHQRRQPALMGTVKTDRGKLQLAVLRGHAVQLANRLAVHGQRAVGHTDAFGATGRTRGVNQVSEVVRAGQVRQVGARQMRDGFAIQFQDRQAVDPGQLIAQP